MHLKMRLFAIKPLKMEGFVRNFYSGCYDVVLHKTI
jgi:hypothetical protein